MTVDIIRELLVHYDNLEGASAVVLIDEIGTHLHPRWKMQIMTRLRSAFPKVQFIATTHDPLCLQGMYDGEVFVMGKDIEGRVGLVDDLPPVEGLRAEQLLTSQYFGLMSTNPAKERLYANYATLMVKRREGMLEASEIDQLEVYSNLLETIPSGVGLREQIGFEVAKSLLEKQVSVPTDISNNKQVVINSVLEQFKNRKF